MKVSLVITTFNEASSIARLLESINQQTLLPEEVIIVDANSTDNTPEIITQLKDKFEFNINLISQASNRSQGRNLGISQAKNSLIAITDAGCILEKHWLERITRPLREDRADSVAGYYLPITPTCFEKCVAPFVAVMPDELDFQTYLPSSRSLAFTKEAWDKVGRYPEQLNYCEDLVFARALKSMTRMNIEPQAIVYWLQSTNLLQFFRQIKLYAQGDIEANYTPHLIKISTVYLRYFLFFLIPPLFFIYLIWPITKHYRHVRHWGCIFFLPLLQLTADSAVIVGSLQAFKLRGQARKAYHII